MRHLTHRTTRVTAVLAAAATVLTGLATALVAPAAPARADDYVSHHEFQANCEPSHVASDDPIVFPGRPGASHLHTFAGNVTTDAYSTPESLLRGATTCRVPADHSAYWFPTVLRAGQPVVSTWEQTFYYKSGIEDYTKVVPFPTGLRFVAGDMMATPASFRAAPGFVEGYECGDSAFNVSLPAWCPPGTQVNIRYQSPSCWDGVHLDSADHRSHMAYPIGGVCPSTHPVAVPMLEYKVFWPVSGDLSDVTMSMGDAWRWHYDFVNAWEPATLAALVRHCINGGLQCDSRGYDLYKPHRGAALTADHRLP
ncbi:DUF1996 domain-containing protein [Cellulomonas fimi]|uniref:DUF1996 domain-containing protein n=1 Tax=Cellulomonas fimi TaxID=1708 RepID=UPI00234D52B8|nr:DUF1996 domain-containing protein [Cellulomonas fimi]MDC7123642.1 DUF1996 domain-containing protein [Cellulomonas fimi]